MFYSFVLFICFCRSFYAQFAHHDYVTYVPTYTEVCLQQRVVSRVAIFYVQQQTTHNKKKSKMNKYGNLCRPTLIIISTSRVTILIFSGSCINVNNL